MIGEFQKFQWIEANHLKKVNIIFELLIGWSNQNNFAEKSLNKINIKTNSKWNNKFSFSSSNSKISNKMLSKDISIFNNKSILKEDKKKILLNAKWQLSNIQILENNTFTTSETWEQSIPNEILSNFNVSWALKVG